MYVGFPASWKRRHSTHQPLTNAVHFPAWFAPHRNATATHAADACSAVAAAVAVSVFAFSYSSNILGMELERSDNSDKINDGEHGQHSPIGVRPPRRIDDLMKQVLKNVRCALTEAVEGGAMAKSTVNAVALVGV
jgi:hypothetical protein